MKKWLSIFTFFFALSLGQAAFAANWQSIEGVKDTVWNNENLQYVADDNGVRAEGDLVIIQIKRPIPANVVKQIADSQTDETLKKDILRVTSEVRNYCYSMTKAEVSYVGAFLVAQNDEIIGEQQIVSEWIPVPTKEQKGALAVATVYEYLKAEVAAGRVK